MSRRRSLALFIAQSVAAGLAAAFVIVLVRPEIANLTRAGGRAEEAQSYARAVAASAPAVVNIYTQPPPDVIKWQGQWRDRRTGVLVAPPTLGSGVIVSPSGYIVTNWHVIDGAEHITVQLADERVASAVVVGNDPETELALLKIEMEGLPSIRLGRSDELEVGEVVLAIGNAYGFSHTVTMGIVSAVGRSLSLASFESFIQTDAAINAGNSGGALVNTRGELVGINTAVLGEAELVGAFEIEGTPEALGFAIPVNLVRGVVDQLIAHGRVIRGYLGVKPSESDIGSEYTRAYGLEGSAVGICEVNGPAAEAGLRRGDVLTHINSQRVYGAQQAMNLVAEMRPGARIEITAARAGTTFKTQAILGERPPLDGEIELPCVD